MNTPRKVKNKVLHFNHTSKSWSEGVNRSKVIVDYFNYLRDRRSKKIDFIRYLELIGEDYE